MSLELSSQLGQKPSKFRFSFFNIIQFSAVILGCFCLFSCNTPSENRLMIPPFKLSTDKAISTVEGLEYQLISSWQDQINLGDTLGMYFNFTAFIPDPSSPSREGLMWINHENINRLFLHQNETLENPSLEEIKLEMQQVGGTLMRLSKNQGNGYWELVPSFDNFRLNANTPIPFSGGVSILGKTQSRGTLANASGGLTPWGTILSSEKNVEDFVGIRQKDQSISASKWGWEKHFDMPPEHYGYIVEIDPKSKTAIKHVALGRLAHTSAKVYSNGSRTIVYSADDNEAGCLYKFVADSPNSLSEGTLYVADFNNKKWLSLNIEDQPLLKANFKDQLSILLNPRLASSLIGGTPIGKSNTIDIEPKTQNIFISLAKNSKKPLGSILKLVEAENPLVMTFQSETIFETSEVNGFANPISLAFDLNSNLWFSAWLDDNEHALMMIPKIGPQKGKCIKMAQAPDDAEFKGLSFGPQGRNLFLSVQHPGITTKSLANLTSHWPSTNTKSIPRSSLISLHGPILDRVSMNLKP